MRYRQLIDSAKRNFNGNTSGKISTSVFKGGAKWMCNQLNNISSSKVEFNESINYTAYGLLKYGVSFLFFFLAFFLLCKINFFLAPLAVFVFYFAEVHFLFLFPLLIDGVRQPIKASAKYTYKLGLAQSMLTTFKIGAFMLAGLLDISKPLRNWHIGCLAIVIWYQHEVRNRL